MGDYIEVAPGRFEKMVGWGAKDASTEYEFYEVFATRPSDSTADGGKNTTILQITGHHLIQSGPDKFVLTERLKVGDPLSHGYTVAKISRVQKVGAYSPLTAHGEVMVAGLSASVYARIDLGVIDGLWGVVELFIPAEIMQPVCKAVVAPIIWAMQLSPPSENQSAIGGNHAFSIFWLVNPLFPIVVMAAAGLAHAANLLGAEWVLFNLAEVSVLFNLAEWVLLG